MIKTLSRFEIGDTTVEYRLDEVSGLVGLRIFPTALAAVIVPQREWQDDSEYRHAAPHAVKVRACPIDSLVQVKCVGDDYPTGFAQGLTMRNGATTLALRYVRQEVENAGGKTTLCTFLSDGSGREAEHRLSWRQGDEAVHISTLFRNSSATAVTLEMLSSFSLGEITPFHPADAPGRLRIHRIRSAWSAEGRLHSQSVEEINLERSWQDHAVRCERFGQVGSMPVRGFFPFAAVEDVEAGVCWGAQLAWAGSWQMEFYRQNDALCLSGGLADREFGHWTKTIAPGGEFITPTATLACVAGDVDALCHRLVQSQHAAADAHPSLEADLPVICNEFCTTWGNPTHENLESLARSLQGAPVRYLVIDAGWYGDQGSEWWNAQGDWQPGAQRFPNGLAATSQMIRGYGLIPGLWFEFEVAGNGSAAFALTNHQLLRDGVPITTTKRHFWDFRDPWVHDYLAEKVIGLLRDGGFGYAKFDYNETIGPGADGVESPGEALRQHIEAVGTFYDRIRRELPELVIECCSSGGHRLEPSMIARSSMSSFSDAHESLEIPIIAANLHRVMLPRQSQIWAVLRSGDDAQRLVFSLAATFLGRMCLSGDLTALTDDQWKITREAMELYQRVAPIIKRGKTQRFGPVVSSYRHPEGWQAILRVEEHGKEALVIAHSFAKSEGKKISIPLPSGEWSALAVLAEGISNPHLAGHDLEMGIAKCFAGAVVHLRRAG